MENLPKNLIEALEEQGHKITSCQNGYYTVISERKLKFSELIGLADMTSSYLPLSQIIRILNVRNIGAVIGENEYDRMGAINELLNIMDGKKSAYANILYCDDHLLIWKITEA